MYTNYSFPNKNRERFPVEVINGKQWKTCTKCLQKKTIDQFRKKNKFGLGYQSSCWPCMKKAVRISAAKSRSK